MPIYMIVQNVNGQKKFVTAFKDVAKAQIYQERWNNPQPGDKRSSIFSMQNGPVEIERLD